MHTMRTVSVCLAAACLVAGCQPLQKRNERAGEMTFQGRDTCYRMSNGDIEVIVAPDIGGRVMAFRFPNDENVVYENPEFFGRLVHIDPPKQFVKYGGCKLWAAPQSDWGWPPNAFWENGQNELKVLGPFMICMSGPREPEAVVQFRRTVSLPLSGTTVVIENEMENVTTGAIEYAIWSICPVPQPSLLIAPLPDDGTNYWFFKYDNPTTPWQKTDKVLYCSATSPQSKLYVVTGKPWAAALRNMQLWVVWGEKHERLSLAAGEAPVEIYLDDEVAELEIMGPARALAPGETTEYTMYWKLFRLHDNTLDAALEKLKEEDFL